MVDLRSDTVTRPTPGMYEAMMNAKVGDDVFGDDPTVNALEAKAAVLFGMEAAVYCPSGTMTNQIAIKVHTQPLNEVIVEKQSHVVSFEGGGIAFHSGASVRLLDGVDGKLTPQLIEDNINPREAMNQPLTTLVSIENTMNRNGGTYYTLPEIAAISDACRRNGLKLHLDGARIFNALIETNNAPKELAAYIDSISVCLSKGLGAPIGSLLIGNNHFIQQARRVRRVMGGGMRQAGFLAAAGIYALDHNIMRMKDDHTRARKIVEALKKATFVKSVLPAVTNIIVFETYKPAIDIVMALKQKGILAVPFGKNKVRMVTHLDIDDEAVEKVCKAISEIVN